MPESLSVIAGIAFVFVLAGFVKGVIGMGLPTVAMGFLTLLMPPAEAATILILPSFVTNVWQLAAGPGLAALLRRIWPMLAAGALATVLGARWLGTVNSAGAVTALGAALMLYALVGLAPLRISLPATAEPWVGPIVGAATGLVTALTGVFVIPAVPYLQALRLDPEDLVQALGLSFTVSTLALAAALASDGHFHGPKLGASLLALAAAFVGMLLGQVLRGRMRPAAFRLWFLFGLMALGADLMLRALF
ncbi:MAG TPA: sulfite exporter TauE/SafE family protein [Xanthobacteraceae bacterium]